jgi:hypothetical protein
MSNIPSLLAYPPVLTLDQIPEINGALVYAIKGYELDGVSILIFFQDKQVGVRVGDFDGNLLDPTTVDPAVINYIDPLGKLMMAANIPQAQFYFSGHTLVDMRISLDKMAGPGMLKDLCGNLLPTQEILAVKPLDEELLESLKEYDYVIFKHSSFKVIVRDNSIIPLYAILRNNDGQVSFLRAEEAT